MWKVGGPWLNSGEEPEGSWGGEADFATLFRAMDVTSLPPVRAKMIE